MPTLLSKDKQLEGAKPKSKADLQREEFLQVMQPRNKKGPSWANEPQSEPSLTSKEAEIAQGVDAQVPAEVVGDKDEGLSDLDWMKRHMSKKADEVERAFEQSDDEDNIKRQDAKTKVCPIVRLSGISRLNTYSSNHNLSSKPLKIQQQKLSCKHLASSFAIWHSRAPTLT